MKYTQYGGNSGSDVTHTITIETPDGFKQVIHLRCGMGDVFSIEREILPSRIRPGLTPTDEYVYGGLNLSTHQTLHSAILDAKDPVEDEGKLLLKPL